MQAVIIQAQLKATAFLLMVLRTQQITSQPTI